MSEIANFEKQLILAVLKGSPPEFNALKNQLDSLEVIDRVGEENVYRVEFQPLLNKTLATVGRSSNMEISDTRLYIEENEGVYHVNLIVLGGYIRWLRVFGKFNFRSAFTIRELFWENIRIPPSESILYTHKSSERNIATAIGYIPTYK